MWEGQSQRSNPGQIMKGHAHNEFCSERAFCGGVKKDDEGELGSRKVYHRSKFVI